MSRKNNFQYKMDNINTKQLWSVSNKLRIPISKVAKHTLISNNITVENDDESAIIFSSGSLYLNLL